MSERVSAHDSVFFMLEGRTTPYSIASLLLLDGGAPARDALSRHLSDVLADVPRFTQRLSDPSGGGGTRWVEDEDFDLAYHLREIRLPYGSAPERLNEVVARLMEQHLDRHRPLWELYVIDPGEAWSALLLKAHHALVDGMTGIYDLRLLFGDGRRTPDPAPPRPSLLQSAVDAGRLAIEAGRGTVDIVLATLRPVSETPFNERIGPNRTFDSIQSSLAVFKDIKDSLGGTVNDVVVAVVAGGLRRWLAERGLPVDDMRLRALVPVSRRRPGATRATGNSVAGLLAPLPVQEPDPVRRLRLVTESVHTSAAHAQSVASGLLLELPALLPTPLVKRVVGIQSVQRYFNLSVTNMRGPDEPLRVAGREVTHVIPVPPLSANAGLLVAVMSYLDSFDLGLVADRALVPDLHVLAEAMEKSIVELAGAAL